MTAVEVTAARRDRRAGGTRTAGPAPRSASRRVRRSASRSRPTSGRSRPRCGSRPGRCPHCGTLALPPRHRCLGCGAEGDAELAELPRDATVYTTTTIHTPVPGLATPYTIVIVELGETGVRLLAQVTGAPPGTVGIGDRGEMVLRRVAERSGIPDYGYAFSPAERSDVEVGR